MLDVMYLGSYRRSLQKFLGFPQEPDDNGKYDTPDFSRNSIVIGILSHIICPDVPTSMTAVSDTVNNLNIKAKT